MIQFSKPIVYVEQSMGYKHSSHVVALDDGKRAIDEDLYGMPLVMDAFQSVFGLDSSVKELVDSTGSISGYSGVCYTDYIHWDFDSDVDLSRSISDALKLCERMESAGISVDESCRIYFSGRKGLHVFLLSEDIQVVSGLAHTNAIVKHVATQFAEGLESFDKAVYDKIRIMRVANSLHSKGDMYKIPLSYSQLKTMNSSEIFALAKTQVEHEFYDIPCRCDYVRECIEEYNSGSVNTSTRIQKGDVLDGIMNGIGNGSRDRFLTSLAGMLHSKNISSDYIFGLISAVNDKGDDPLPDEDLERIVKSVSRYKVDPKYVPPKDTDIKTMTDAYERWKYVRLNSKKISTGFGKLDNELYVFDEGKVLMLAARAGIGKTSFGMQIGEKIAASLGGECLFTSLEMSSSAIFYRAAKISGSYDCPDATNEEFTNMLLEDEMACKVVAEQWAHLKIVDKDNLTIDQIEAYYNTLQEMNGNTTKVLMVDYLGLINGADDYHGVSAIARELKNMAKRLNTRVVMLVQLSRGAGDGTVEPLLSHMRDSGSIEEAADMIVGMWGASNNNKRIHCKFLKNRDGERGVKFDLIQTGLAYECVDYDTCDDNVHDEPKMKWGKG